MSLYNRRVYVYASAVCCDLLTEIKTTCCVIRIRNLNFIDDLQNNFKLPFDHMTSRGCIYNISKNMLKAECIVVYLMAYSNNNTVTFKEMLGFGDFIMYDNDNSSKNDSFSIYSFINLFKIGTKPLPRTQIISLNDYLKVAFGPNNSATEFLKSRDDCMNKLSNKTVIVNLK
jgi:hypothetical protein